MCLNTQHALLNIYIINVAGRWWNVTWKLSIEFILCAQAKGKWCESAISHLISIVWYRTDSCKGIRLPCIFVVLGTMQFFIIYKTFQPPSNWGPGKIHVFFLVKIHQDNTNTQTTILLMGHCRSRKRGITTRMKSIHWYTPHHGCRKGIIWSTSAHNFQIWDPRRFIRHEQFISFNIHMYWNHRRWWYANIVSTLDNMFRFGNQLTPVVAYLKVSNNLSELSNIFSCPASTLKWHHYLTLRMKKKSNLFQVNCRERWNALGIWHLKADNKWKREQNLVFPKSQALFLIIQCSESGLVLDNRLSSLLVAKLFGGRSIRLHSPSDRDRWSVSSVSWL